jgi:hypothetical protein
MWWFIIGIINAFINGAIRKIDTDGNMLLAWGWVVFWFMTPIGLIARNLKNIENTLNKLS